ncbi:MAG TPA: hypothetical protein VM140_14450 [Burkholderiales bacterium]|nr:hypothetical protein [Burkholderiales bacterium]
MRILLVVLLATWCAAAAAQLRTIPQEAKLATIRHVESMAVELDGQPQQLSPGAQIRDADNRLVLPASLQEKQQAMILLDGSGMVHRVWLLSAQEQAALPVQPSPIPK